MGVALRDLILPYKLPAGWDTLGGVAAIDTYNTLYQFLTIIRQPDGTPLMDSRGRVTSHLSGLLFRTQNLISRGIRPVFVFDGAPPALKEATLAVRRTAREEAGEKYQEALARGDMAEAYRQARASAKVDSFILQTSRQLLDLMGLPVVQAPGEGEAQAVHMVLQGNARYIISQDYDALLFGAPRLVRNLTISGKRKLHGRSVTVNPESLVLSDILAGLGISREGLIEVGLLCGTDFNPGVRGIGPKTGLRIVREGRFSEVIREKAPDFNPDPVKELFLHPPVTEDYHLVWGEPDIGGILRMLCDSFEFDEERVRKAFDSEKVPTGQKTLSSWF